MWAIRVLNGPLAGRTFPLRSGQNIVGRGQECQIVFPIAGVSKQHTQIQIIENKAMIADLNSRNGTFVNGVRVKAQRLRSGDKVQFNEIICEVLEIDEAALLNGAALRPPMQISSGAAKGGQVLPLHPQQESYASHGALALQTDLSPGPQYAEVMQPALLEENPPGKHASSSMGPLAQVVEVIKNYTENVAMPGVYRLAQIAEFRWVVFGFIILFVFIVTAFSVIPMTTITKENIQKESQRRALTIAKNLATVNRNFVLEKRELSLNTQVAEGEPGVTQALIVSTAKGTVLAPHMKVGLYPEEPFVHKARKQKDDYVEQLTDSKIAASVSISSFDPDLGTTLPKAHAIVFYDIDETAIDFNHTLSLFIQSFVFASLLASFLYYLLLKLMQYPIRQMNMQLDRILKENHGEIRFEFMDPMVQHFVSNLNSALSRMGSSFESNSSPTGSETSMREAEAISLVQMMGWPALALSAVDLKVLAVNNAFYQLQTGTQALENQSVDALTDPALRESLKDLILQMRSGLSHVRHDLPSGGSDTYQIEGQKIQGKQDTAYFIFSIIIHTTGGET